MCVILYKPKNVKLPKDNILFNCFMNNDDGAGYTYAVNNNVIVKKGFLNYTDFIKALKKDYKKYNLEKHNLILHFRIGTSGGITKEKTQPFKISNNIKELNKLYVNNKKSSIVHNGVFYKFEYNKNNTSDTQNYIKDFLQPLLASGIKNKKDLIKDSLGYNSKIAVLNKKDNVFLYGEYYYYNGVYYSNNSWNNYQTKPHTIKYDFNGDTKTILENYNHEKTSGSNDYLKLWSYDYNLDEGHYIGDYYE